MSSYLAYGQEPQPTQPAKPSTPPSPSQAAADTTRRPLAGGIDQGWAFDATPAPPLVDEAGGFLRFKISISAEGRLTAVKRVAGTMSAKQTRLCQQHILEQFTVRRTRPDAGAATGYFTFRYRAE